MSLTKVGEFPPAGRENRVSYDERRISQAKDHLDALAKPEVVLQSEERTRRVGGQLSIVAPVLRRSAGNLHGFGGLTRLSQSLWPREPFGLPRHCPEESGARYYAGTWAA